MVDYDLVIVGAGPAGLATAICAAQRGLHVVVVERRRPPLDKACGEGVMPLGVAALDAMGVHIPPDARAALAGIRYIDGGTIATAAFSGPAWGVRRLILSEAMAERASALGVTLVQSELRDVTRLPGRVEAHTDHGTLAGRLLVGADGLHSRVRRLAGLDARARPRGRYGVRRHYKVEPWSAYVEVHWADGGEAYVTPVGPRQVGVAILHDRTAGDFDAMLARFPALAGRLRGAPATSETRGAGPLAQAVHRRAAPGIALIGDAAGYLDAASGEGVTLALRSARALVDVYEAGEPLVAYERAHRRICLNYYVMTTAILALTRHPWLRRRVVGLLARRPALFARLLAITGGQAPLAWVGASNVIPSEVGIPLAPSRLPGS